jgi:hypothetical protein
VRGIPGRTPFARSCRCAPIAVKDDRFDAYVLADVLRTDRARLRPLSPDSPATATLRSVAFEFEADALGEIEIEILCRSETGSCC